MRSRSIASTVAGTSASARSVRVATTTTRLRSAAESLSAPALAGASAAVAAAGSASSRARDKGCSRIGRSARLGGRLADRWIGWLAGARGGGGVGGLAQGRFVVARHAAPVALGGMADEAAVASLRQVEAVDVRHGRGVHGEQRPAPEGVNGMEDLHGIAP